MREVRDDVRVLLDEMLDQRLKEFLPKGAMSVRERGWGSKKNGELLRLAEKEFDVLLTSDKGIPHQQNLTQYDLAVVILRSKSNRFEDLSELMDEANEAIGKVRLGTATFIDAGEYK